MTRKVLFDTAVYVQALRAGDLDILRGRTWKRAAVCFSAVVGSELLRGERDPSMVRALLHLWRDAEGSRRLLVPLSSDWQDAGIVLARIGAKYGYDQVGRARLVHDTLIALSARRQGITVVTHNVADFERIREFRQFSLLAADG